jgi:hypothetical protein
VPLIVHRESGIALHTGALVAAFRCDAPARCGAFADERRIVAGDNGGRAYRRARASLGASFAAGVRELAVERMIALHTAVRIATFHCAAPARCGACVD